MNRPLDGAGVAIAASEEADGAVLVLSWVAAGAGKGAMRVSWAICTEKDDISCKKHWIVLNAKFIRFKHNWSIHFFSSSIRNNKTKKTNLARSSSRPPCACAWCLDLNKIKTYWNSILVQIVLSSSLSYQRIVK
jgi:hypothetical protein